jgi:hypothetical protein
MLATGHERARLDCEVADHFGELDARCRLVRDDPAFTLGDGLPSMRAFHPEAYPGGCIAGAAQ